MGLTDYHVFLVILTYLLITVAVEPRKDGPLLFHTDSFPGSRSFTTYEEIEPQIIYKKKKISSTLRGKKHLQNVTVFFKAFGRNFILDLTQNKELFSSSYIEKRHHSFGSHKHQPKITSHCFYHGTIRNRQRSMVAVSTCDGVFRGLIADDRDTYHLEEHHGSHRLYRDSDQLHHLFKCGNDHGSLKNFHFNTLRSFRRRKRSIRGPYDGNENTRFVELYLVNDHKTVLNHNTNQTIKRSQDIVNIVSRLYRPLNIYVALVGVEVWEKRDLIKVTPSPDITLENFLRYRRERINPFHTNDNAQLITGTKFDEGVVGKAIKGRICTFQFSGGVNYDYDGVTTLATTVAHEMGHSFGMEHDNDSYCHCPDNKCIMAATSGMTSPTKWSSCSKAALQESFEIGMDYCLQNKPEKIFHGPVCGNGLVEEGEACDCGLPQDCTNRCCNASTCKLIPLAACATGRCCNLNNCQFKPSATLCRAPKGECDLAEFCSGADEYCPDDVYKQNGMSCANTQSYCYEGKCNTHTSQCKLLWGNTGRASDPICYQQLNMQGTHDGNCGYNWTRSYYTRCRREDVMCGLLHCVHLNEKLMFWKDSLAHTMRASFLTRGNTQYVCRSAMLDVGIDMPDPGMVPDGAKCEEEKICVSQKCVPLAKMDIAQCTTNCDNHGVCNSKGNCHCEVGYAPPLCDKPGYGGSIDSGPASDEYVNVILLAGLLVFFLLVLLAIILFLAYFYRQKICQLWKTLPQFNCKLPTKPTFKKKPDNSSQPPNNLNRQRVVSPPQGDPSQPILSNSLNRKSKVVISNPSQQKPLVPKHEPRPFTQITNIKNREDPNIFKNTKSEKVQNTDLERSKVSKFVPENRIFKPEGKPKEQPPRISWQNVPLPPEPVASPATERKPVPETKPSLPEKKPQPEKSLVKKLSIKRSMSDKKQPAPVTQQLSPKIAKRESFTSADISHPVLVSTTNRNSDLFDDLPDTLPRVTHISRSPSARSPPPVPAHGTAATVKRSQSDRAQIHRSPNRPAVLATQEEEVPTQKYPTLDRIHRSQNRPAMLATQEEVPTQKYPTLDRIHRSQNRPATQEEAPSQKYPTLDRPRHPAVTAGVARSRSPAASASFRSKSPPTRPVPPEPRVPLPPKPAPQEDTTVRSSGVYMNNPTVMEGDLLDDITQYINTHLDFSPDKPVTYTNIPEGSKAFEQQLPSEEKNNKGSNSSKATPVNRFSRDTKNNNVGRDIKSGAKNLSNSTKLQKDGKPSITSTKPEISKPATPNKNFTSKPGAKPADKTHVSRINSTTKPETKPGQRTPITGVGSKTKPATPPKSAAIRAKSPTGQGKQISALAAQFNKDQTNPSVDVKPTKPSVNRPKPNVKRIQSFNV